MTIEKRERNKKELPNVLRAQIMDYLNPPEALRDMAVFSQISKNHTLFQPVLDDFKVPYPLLFNVVWGNCAKLKEQVLTNPLLLFKKGQIKAPSGQTYCNVSPYQLMTFLCDDDMMSEIMPLIPKTYQLTIDNRTLTMNTESLRRQQYAEINSGGADLVKMDRDPTRFPFEEITRFITSYTIGDLPTTVTFPLLENPDGIIYYQDPVNKSEHLYYANQITQRVELLKLKKCSEEDQKALTELYASFAEMEDNSSRRSSNKEHKLIARTTERQLSRKGIQYEYKGTLYRDSRMEFRLINAYRKCFRLYEMPPAQFEASTYWLKGVGVEQRQVSWILQRICELNRPFTPGYDFTKSSFIRDFTIFNDHSSKKESIFSGNRYRELGSRYALCKGATKQARGIYRGKEDGPLPHLIADLIVINQLIEAAKANVAKCTVTQELSAEDITANIRP